MVCSSLSDTSGLEAQCWLDGEGSCPMSLHLAFLGMKPSRTSQGKHYWGLHVLSSAIPKVEPLFHKYMLVRRRKTPPLGCTHLVLSFNNRKLGRKIRNATVLPLPGKQPSGWQLEGEGALCSWLQDFGGFSTSLSQERGQKVQVLVLILPTPAVLVEVQQIFMNKCFFICCIPVGLYPETLNNCF